MTRIIQWEKWKKKNLFSDLLCCSRQNVGFGDEVFFLLLFINSARFWSRKMNIPGCEQNWKLVILAYRRNLDLVAYGIFFSLYAETGSQQDNRQHVIPTNHLEMTQKTNQSYSDFYRNSDLEIWMQKLNRLDTQNQIPKRSNREY